MIIRMQDILTTANKDQRKAITHDKGPLLVIAGAGTGKTAVITKRIAWLISEKKALPSEILALTFTEKAAAEMEERVDELVPYGFVDTWISTFHSFGDRILRENALDLGITGDFKVLSTAEQVIFFSDNLSAFDLDYYAPLSNPTKHIEALLSHFSRLKDELISPQEYLEFAETKLAQSKNEDETQEIEKTLEIARAYATYQRLMVEAGNLDFGDQITAVADLFKNHPKILEKYQDQFKYILVDEFQDTNYAQNELLKLLAEKTKNIMVVGDDDQAIYRFRGAAVSNILNFTRDYSGCSQIVLTENYRSCQPILDAAYKSVVHNNPERLEVKNGIEKKLKSQVKTVAVNPVQHLHCNSVLAEADQVASIIKEKFEGGLALKDFAILVRSNSLAKPFIQALSYYGIPYKFSGTAGLYNRSEIRTLIHFAKTLIDPADDLSFFHLITSEVYGLDVREAVLLNAENRKTKRGLSEIAKKINIPLSEAAFQIIEKLNFDLNKFRQKSTDMTAGQIIYEFLKTTGWLSALVQKAQSDPQSEVAVQNIAKFFEKIEEFERVSHDKSIYNFVKHLVQLMEAGDDPAMAEVDPDLEAVNLLTVHKSKGLEFPIVFVSSLVAGAFPTTRKGEGLPVPQELVKEKFSDGDWHIQEERRLFYVALTRAKDELYLTSAEDYGGKKKRKISPFVLEAIDSPMLDKERVKLDKLQVIKRFEKQPEIIIPKKFNRGHSQIILSPYQIDDYLSCPKKFEFIHVLKIPILTHHSVVYGSAIHKAIEVYFSQKLGGEKVTLEEILEAFKNNWRSEGFVTREHEDRRFQQGQKTLITFFEREEMSERLPSQIEESFEFNIPEISVRVRGRFDAIYQDTASAKGKEAKSSKLKVQSEELEIKANNKRPMTNDSPLEIRDFKTSRVDNQKQADDKAKKKRQLSIYALAKQRELGIIPLVSLYFVDSGLIGRSKRTEKELAKTIEEIRSVAEGIKEDNFLADPGYRECSWCAYREICPFTLSNDKQEVKKQQKVVRKG